MLKYDTEIVATYNKFTSKEVRLIFKVKELAYIFSKSSAWEIYFPLKNGKEYAIYKLKL